MGQVHFLSFCALLADLADLKPRNLAKRIVYMVEVANPAIKNLEDKVSSDSDFAIDRNRDTR